jgi:hypothetical protein
MTTCHIPIVFKKARIINNELCIGGQFSNNIPIENCITITVSPTAQANIAPGNDIFVDKTVKNDELLFENGFEDAVKWLSNQRKNGVLPKELFQ